MNSQTVKNRWDEPAYRKIQEVVYADGLLVVTFGDGSQVELKPEALFPGKSEHARWKELGHDAYVLTVPLGDGELDVSWMDIRALTDSGFSEFLGKKAAEEAGKVGERIRSLRRLRKIKSKELATKAGITPQSLSRIEHGHHDVAYKTLKRILGAMNCELRDLSTPPIRENALQSVVRRLEKVGIDRDFFFRRLLPPGTTDFLASMPNAANSESMFSQIFEPIERIYAWGREDVLKSAPLVLNPRIVAAAKFKIPGMMQRRRATAYSVYAHYLAGLIDHSAKNSMKALPDNPKEIRDTVIKKYGGLNFEAFLSFVWDLGIPILPLTDPGAFHGACWRFENRAVIVLKQLAGFHARWLYDLVHEYAHIVLKHLGNQGMLLEGQAISPFSGGADEDAASAFVSQVLFGGQEENLAEKCVDMAKGKVEFLKIAVARVATMEKVPEDLLANYVAHRLSMQGINWWGSANAFQENDPLAWDIATKFLRKKISFARLNVIDRELLERALAFQEME